MGDATYVNAPKFFDRVESDDLLEQIIPVVALGREAVSHMGRLRRARPFIIPCHSEVW